MNYTILLINWIPPLNFYDYNDSSIIEQAIITRYVTLSRKRKYKVNDVIQFTRDRLLDFNGEFAILEKDVIQVIRNIEDNNSASTAICRT